MSRVWVLDTETKGTGANMIPLDRVLKKPSAAAEPLSVPRKPSQPAPEVVRPREPRKFKVVDLMTRRVAADDVSAREAIDVLKNCRSVVDVSVYVWQPERERWRLLTLAERGELWNLRHA